MCTDAHSSALPRAFQLSTPALVESSFRRSASEFTMRVSIMLQITADDGTSMPAEEVVALEKATDQAEDVGLSLADGKALTAAVQRRVVQAQVMSWTGRHRCCEECGASHRSKGSYPILFRTLYGDVEIASPRLHRCSCQAEGPATVSQLRRLLPGHVAPRSRRRWRGR